jgi:HNH endonuclease
MPNFENNYGTSRISVQKRMRRSVTYRMTNGKCFYCGNPLLHQGQPEGRDWLFVRPQRHRMVQEHVIPTSRGGNNSRDNYVPACAGCNRAKGPFTLTEFRFIRGLEVGSLSFHFAFEPPPGPKRDWIICCGGPAQQRDLILHNLPSAADGFYLQRRDPNGIVREPRVRPLSA